VDSKLRPHPQMAEGHTVSDNGRVWEIKLRDGLKFHDGEPVLARDCAASLKRWGARDIFGQTLASFVEEWGTKDDRTIRISLKAPFPMLPNALGKPNGMIAAMMPERLAKTDPNKQVTEMVGSGPYRFLKDEYVSGSSAAYRRFENYVPRDEKAEWTSGGKRANIEMVQWRTIPDMSTAAAALQNGEADWWEQTQPDMIPMMRKRADLTVAATNPIGYVGVMRFNHLNAPFNNPAIRRAVLLGLRQEDYMRAVTGNDTNAFKECKSLFPCGTQYGQELGKDLITGDLDAARAALKAAGYNNEKVVIINPADVASIAPFGHVTYDYFRKLGLNVELADTDWGTVIQRRNNKGPVDQGGWSVFHSWWIGTSVATPAVSTMIRGLGATGWPGWYSSALIEKLTSEWLVATNEEERNRLIEAIHRDSLNQVPTVPLGQFSLYTTYSKKLTGMLEGTTPYPWNLAWT
jgi:peptide/nickel transport system substrate-binding protein